MNYNIEKDLQHNSSIKIQSILILLVILASLASAIYFYIQLQKTNQHLVSTNEELSQIKAALEQREETILNIQDSIFILLKQLNAKNMDSAFLKQTERLIQKSNTASTKIRVHTLNVDDKTTQKVRAFLENQGYSIVLFRKLEERESWLANRPSIFYYQQGLTDKANNLSKELSQLTGLTFSSTVGAGKTLTKAERQNLFNIHLIGNK